MKDAPILEGAVREQRVGVPTDKDVEEMVYRQDNPHAGIVRLAHVRVARRLTLLQHVLRHYSRAIGPGVIVTAEQRKIRVTRRGRVSGFLLIFVQRKISWGKPTKPSTGILLSFGPRLLRTSTLSLEWKREQV